MYRIFIVEDDDKIAIFLQNLLEKYGYQAIRAMRFRDLKQEFLEAQPHLTLLDINLPHYDGYYWCRQIRTVSNAPILFVSARSGELEQVLAIENGGDDYIAKPFHLDVIMAKVKSALRRAYGEYASASTMKDVREAGGLLLNLSRNVLEYEGKQAELTQNECQLLQCLMDDYGGIVSRETLLEALWDDVSFVEDNTLTVNVTRVRKKLEEIGLPGGIETIRGRGYRLSASGEPGMDS